MLRPIFAIIALAASLCGLAATYSVKTVPNVQLADSTRYVSNPDGILSAATVAELDNTLRRLRNSTGVETAVVVIDDFDDDDIDTFATELFQEWGLGKKGSDNGLLIVVAKDRRKAVIRPGYGLEGVFPDILAGRILRNIMFPAFRDNDFDGGISGAVAEIDRLLSDPEAAEELVSESEREEEMSFSEIMMSLLTFIFWMIVISTVPLLIYTLWFVNSLKRLSPVDAWAKVESRRPVYLAFSVFGVGVPLFLWKIVRREQRRLRDKPRMCPNCGTAMNKLDEETDNLYLTPTQDSEEKYNSVDYDVWLCPNCNETDILPYVNRRTPYKECPQCHGLTLRMIGERVVVQPTSRREGRGARTYYCYHCKHRDEKEFVIPRKDDGGLGGAVAAGAAGAFASRGGGFGGGGFGGGFTGGGGASGGW